MSINCDGCECDLTPCEEYEYMDNTMLRLNGKKVLLCMNCFHTLSEYCGSKEHKEATKKYMAEFENISIV